MIQKLIITIIESIRLKVHSTTNMYALDCCVCSRASPSISRNTLFFITNLRIAFFLRFLFYVLATATTRQKKLYSKLHAYKFSNWVDPKCSFQYCWYAISTIIRSIIIFYMYISIYFILCVRLNLFSVFCFLFMDIMWTRVHSRAHVMQIFNEA